MAGYSSDPVADFQSAEVALRAAKRKFDMYQGTLKKIPRDGVHLGNIIDVETTRSKTVLNLVDNLVNLAEPRAFCCGGWVELSKSDADMRLLMYADKSKDGGWPITKLPVESLLEFCTPAPYGDLTKQETVYNPSVRLAHECPANKFIFMKKADGRRRRSPFYQSPQFLDIISKKVSSTLANEKDITLMCYKLNVYGKGGFFSAHVDTPVDATNMIGTVVVCLPCPHTGGELIVKHKGLKEEFLFANMSEDQARIQWASFYSDCVHEILPVRSGNRITLTYNIIRKKQLGIGKRSGSCKSENFFTGPKIEPDQKMTLDNIVTDVVEVARAEGLEQFGIFLRHKYTMSALATGNLKGCDQVLYDGLLSRGLTCHRLTVLVHENEKKPDEDGVNYWEDLEEREVYAFSAEDMAYVNKQAPKPQHATWKDMQFIKDWSKGQVMIEKKEKEARNCGNYTEPGEVDRLYLQSTVIIDIPDRSEEEEGVEDNQGENVKGSAPSGCE